MTGEGHRSPAYCYELGTGQLVQYLVVGLVIGGVYAISATGIVVTYVSTGVLNFAFAGLAYFIARFYNYLLVQQHLGIATSAVLAVFVSGPALGVVLYLLLFRWLRSSTDLIKITATIGLSVVAPTAASLLFGNPPDLSAPGLAPVPVRVFDILGVGISLDQLIAYGFVIVLLVFGAFIFRFTDVGLRVRAMVSSEAMTSLSGVNPGAISISVWAVTTGLAGVAGVLTAPIIGLNSDDFQVLIVGAFAAVVAARLTRVGVAVVVGFAMGIFGAVFQWLVPPSSEFAQAVVPSIPFLFMAVFLTYEATFGDGRNTPQSLTVLDDAIRTYNRPTSLGGVEAGQVGAALGRTGRRRLISQRVRADLVPGAVIVSLMLLAPLMLPMFWGQMIGEALALAVVFLSISLTTGEGGLIWLCQITFAGAGAIATAYMATQWGVPVIAAMVVAGALTALMGAVISGLTIRLGDLYVALVTLSFALLMSDLVFTLNIFFQQGAGVQVFPPQFALSWRGFDYFAMAVFIVLGVLVYLLRVSTSGLALSAIRSSRRAAAGIGLNVNRNRIVLCTFAAFVAGVGGGLLAMYSGTAVGSDFAPAIGLVWFAVVVTVGVRSNSGALVAAVSTAFLPAIFLRYLPQSVAQVPALLFGVGAVLVAKNPGGILQLHRHQLNRVIHRLRGGDAGVDALSGAAHEETPSPMIDAGCVSTASFPQGAGSTIDR